MSRVIVDCSQSQHLLPWQDNGDERRTVSVIVAVVGDPVTVWHLPVTVEVAVEVGVNVLVVVVVWGCT